MESTRNTFTGEGGKSRVTEESGMGADGGKGSNFATGVEVRTTNPLWREEKRILDIFDPTSLSDALPLVQQSDVRSTSPSAIKDLDENDQGAVQYLPFFGPKLARTYLELERESGLVMDDGSTLKREWQDRLRDEPDWKEVLEAFGDQRTMPTDVEGRVEYYRYINVTDAIWNAFESVVPEDRQPAGILFQPLGAFDDIPLPYVERAFTFGGITYGEMLEVLRRCTSALDISSRPGNANNPPSICFTLLHPSHQAIHWSMLQGFGKGAGQARFDIMPLHVRLVHQASYKARKWDWKPCGPDKIKEVDEGVERLALLLWEQIGLSPGNMRAFFGGLVDEPFRANGVAILGTGWAKQLAQRSKGRLRLAEAEELVKAAMEKKELVFGTCLRNRSDVYAVISPDTSSEAFGCYRITGVDGLGDARLDIVSQASMTSGWILTEQIDRESRTYLICARTIDPGDIQIALDNFCLAEGALEDGTITGGAGGLLTGPLYEVNGMLNRRTMQKCVLPVMRGSMGEMAKVPSFEGGEPLLRDAVARSRLKCVFILVRDSPLDWSEATLPRILRQLSSILWHPPSALIAGGWGNVDAINVVVENCSSANHAFEDRAVAKVVDGLPDGSLFLLAHASRLTRRTSDLAHIGELLRRKHIRLFTTGFGSPSAREFEAEDDEAHGDDAGEEYEDEEYEDERDGSKSPAAIWHELEVPGFKVVGEVNIDARAILARAQRRITESIMHFGVTAVLRRALKGVDSQVGADGMRVLAHALKAFMDREDLHNIILLVRTSVDRQASIATQRAFLSQITVHMGAYPVTVLSLNNVSAYQGNGALQGLRGVDVDSSLVLSTSLDRLTRKGEFLVDLVDWIKSKQSKLVSLVWPAEYGQQIADASICRSDQGLQRIHQQNAPLAGGSLPIVLPGALEGDLMAVGLEMMSRSKAYVSALGETRTPHLLRESLWQAVTTKPVAGKDELATEVKAYIEDSFDCKSIKVTTLCRDKAWTCPCSAGGGGCVNAPCRCGCKDCKPRTEARCPTEDGACPFFCACNCSKHKHPTTVQLDRSKNKKSARALGQLSRRLCATCGQQRRMQGNYCSKCTRDKRGPKPCSRSDCPKNASENGKFCSVRCGKMHEELTGEVLYPKCRGCGEALLYGLWCSKARCLVKRSQEMAER